MFITQKDHNQYLKKLIIEKPDEVMIATYNIYAGILHDGEDAHSWGEKYHSDAHEILDMLCDCKRVRIIVGTPPLSLCKAGCEDCIAKQYKSATRLSKHALKWPKYQWKYTGDFHLKCYLFKKDGIMKGVIGGRNLSDSNWVDVTFNIDDKHCKVIEYLFNQSWDKSTDITIENLESSIMKQVEEASWSSNK